MVTLRDPGLGLKPTHFDEGLVQGGHLFGGDGKGGQSSFDRGGHDEFGDLAMVRIRPLKAGG